MPNYPDLTKTRMAYDRDGSVGFTFQPDNIVVLSTALDLQTFNNENDDIGGTWRCFDQSCSYGLVFPQLRDLTGVWSAIDSFFANPNVQYLQTSTDTTNGYDGTWTNVMGPYTADIVPVVPKYRNDIQNLVGLPGTTGVKAIRFLNAGSGGSTHRVAAMHLYGSYSSGQTPDRLQLWHPTLDQALDVTPNYFNWGDTPQGSQETRTFRIKNISSTKTANSVQAQIQANTDASPTLLAQFDLSLDGINYVPSLAVTPSLGPGVISSTIYCRKWLANSAQPGVWVQRIIATAASFT